MTAEKKPKFVIIYPRIPGIKFFGIQIVNQDQCDPLGALHLGTYLQGKDIDVAFINTINNDNWQGELVSSLEGADLVGISIMTEQLPHALVVLERIKEISPDIPVVVGGTHATLYPRQCISHPYIDYAIIGDGEYSTEDLIRCIVENEDISEIDGIAFKRDEDIIINEKKRRFNFCEMPLINYRLLGEGTYNSLHENSVGVLASRGCPMGCTFCINSVIKEKRMWSYWGPERVIKEIEALLEKGVKDIAFWDENFFTRKDRAEKIISLIEEKGLEFTWFSNIRADYFRDDYINEDFLKKLEKCGLTRFGLGAESGSQQTLDYLQKRTTPNMYIKVAEMTAKTKIIPYFSFMIGLPGETREDIEKTLDIIYRIQDANPKAKFAGPQLYRPYPGSEVYNDCVKSGWNPPESLEEWASHISKNILETDTSKMPWVIDPEFTRTAWFYSLFLKLSYRQSVHHFLDYCKNNKHGIAIKIFGSTAIIAVCTIGKIRYKLNCHKIPLEINTLKVFRTALSA